MTMPDTLRGRGRRLWDGVIADHELVAWQLVLLPEACRAKDYLDQLAPIAAAGDFRAMREERLTSLSMTRLLPRCGCLMPPRGDRSGVRSEVSTGPDGRLPRFHWPSEVAASLGLNFLESAVLCRATGAGPFANLALADSMPVQFFALPWPGRRTGPSETYEQ